MCIIQFFMSVYGQKALRLPFSCVFLSFLYNIVYMTFIYMLFLINNLVYYNQLQYKVFL